MTKAKFLVVYCLFISGLCCMANVTKDINMRFKDVRQGLSHQTVNCFYQDEFGFLWIGTQDGLNRFDGRKFEVFKPDNANPYSININNIRQVCGNKAGLLFIRSLQSVTLYDMRLNRFRVLRRSCGNLLCARCIMDSYRKGNLPLSQPRPGARVILFISFG